MSKERVKPSGDQIQMDFARSDTPELVQDDGLIVKVGYSPDKKPLVIQIFDSTNAVVADKGLANTGYKDGDDQKFLSEYRASQQREEQQHCITGLI